MLTNLHDEMSVPLSQRLSHPVSFSESLDFVGPMRGAGHPWSKCLSLTGCYGVLPKRGLVSVSLYPASTAHSSPPSLRSPCSEVLPWQVDHVTLAESVPVNYLRCSDVDHESCFQLLPAWCYTCDK